MERKKLLIAVGIGGTCVGIAALCIWGFVALSAPDVREGQDAAAANGSPALTDNANAATSSETINCGQSPGVSCVQYRNEEYHFSLYYSQRRDVKTYDEGGGAATIVFQNEELVRGFQIFVIPYTGDRVTEERFKLDNPSGVRNNEVGVTVSGAPGVAFESKAPTLGDTYEIWFLHGGYLYEITTLLSRKDAMNDIMQTWRFI